MDLEKDERVAFKGLLEALTPGVLFVDAFDELYLRQENPHFVHKGREAEAVQLPQGPLSTFWRLVNLLNVYGTACG
jgi:hypothetical protein